MRFSDLFKDRSVKRPLRCKGVDTRPHLKKGKFKDNVTAQRDGYSSHPKKGKFNGTLKARRDGYSSPP